MAESAGREASWSGLEPLRGDLWGFVSRRCRDDADADDVVQETLLRAARHRGSLIEAAKLRPWARRIARNVLCDRARRAARVPCAVGAEADLDALAAPAEDGAADGGEVRCGPWMVDRDEALEILADELGGLRAEDRELLFAYYGGAGSCREAGLARSLSPTLVKVRLFRARRRLLRAILRRLGLGRGGDDWAQA